MTKPNLYLVFAKFAEGRDEEFHRWYTDHAAEFLEEVDACVGTQRYNLSQVRGLTAEHLDWDHLAVYELEGDPEAAMAQVSAAVSEGRFVATLAPDVIQSMASAVYTPVDVEPSRR